jgi:hypothetical protein
MFWLRVLRTTLVICVICIIIFGILPHFLH